MTHAATPADWQLAPLPTPQQVAFYKEHGYLTYGRVFNREEWNDLSHYLDRLLSELPAGKRPEWLDVPHFENPYLFKFLLHPRVLDVIETFIGPDIVLWSSHFISKPQGDGLAVPWHTDANYWGHRLDPMEVITLWLAMDPSTRENGCMRVIPGTHKNPNEWKYVEVDQRENVFDSEIEGGQFTEADAVDLELAPGECHFHDAWTIHGSRANHSERRRCGYTMRYFPAHVVFHPRDAKDTHKVYLARGEDRTGGRTVYSEVPMAQG
jgi:ectoine hydroxylase-related dioxygenase (phytanoyl-CoA dioxygenase family)